MKSIISYNCYLQRNRLLNSTSSHNLIQHASKCFGDTYGNHNLRYLKKKTEAPQMKDYSKGYKVTKYFEDAEREYKTNNSQLITKTIEETQNINSVSAQSPKKMKFKSLVKPNRAKIQKFITNNNSIQFNNNRQSQKKGYEDMFSLDYNAQTLENLKRAKEYKVFCQKDNRIKLREHGLKLESKKLDNLIKNSGEFKDYSIYNNTQNIFKNNTYGIIDFLPEGQSPIGESYGKENPKYKKKIDYNIQEEKEFSYMKYKQKKNDLENIRIKSLFSSNSNEKLKNILQNLGNQSVSLLNNEKKEQIITINEEEDTQLTVYNKNNDNYEGTMNREVEIVREIAKYEAYCVVQAKQQDIYSKYHKRPEFDLLPLKEVLNYVKFDIRNTRELFSMFHEYTSADKRLETIKDYTSFSLNYRNASFINRIKLGCNLQSPLIFSQMLQKISLPFLYNSEVKNNNLFNLLDYNLLLKKVKENLPNYDIKVLVDTFYGLSFIHKDNRDYNYLFFQHTCEEFIEHIDKLLKENVLKGFKNKEENFLSFIPLQLVSVICRALDNLNIKETKNEAFVIAAENKLKLSLLNIINHANTFNDLNFFCTQNIVDYLNNNYVLEYLTNDSFNQDSLIKTDLLTGTLDKLTSALLFKIEDPNESERLYHDNVFITSYTEFAGNTIKLLNQEEARCNLLIKEIIKQEDVTDEEREKKLDSINNQLTVINKLQVELDLIMNKTIYFVLQNKNFDFNNIAIISNSFSDIKKYDSKLFENLIVKGKDKIELLEYSSFDHLMLYFHSIASYFNRNAFENLHKDVFNIISKENNKVNTKDFRFIIFDTYFTSFKRLLDLLQHSNHDFSKFFIVLYNLYLIGYAKEELFLQSMGYFLENKENLLKALGFLFQIVSMKKYREEAIIYPLIKTFIDYQSELVLKEGNNVAFIFAQVLASLVKLNVNFMITTEEIDLIKVNTSFIINSIISSKNYVKNNFIQEKLNSLILAFLSFQVKLDIDEKERERISLIYKEKYEQSNPDNKLSSSEKSLLQIDIKDRVNYDLLEYVSLSKLHANEKIAIAYVTKYLEQQNVFTLNKKEDAFMNTIEEIYSYCKKADLDKIENYSISGHKVFYNTVKSALNKCNNRLFVNNQYYSITINHVLNDTFIIPIYFKNLDLALLLYNDSDLEASGLINGFTLIRETLIKQYVKNVEIVWRDANIANIENNEHLCIRLLEEMIKAYICKEKINDKI